MIFNYVINHLVCGRWYLLVLCCGRSIRFVCRVSIPAFLLFIWVGVHCPSSALWFLNSETLPCWTSPWTLCWCEHHHLPFRFGITMNREQSHKRLGHLACPKAIVPLSWDLCGLGQFLVKLNFAIVSISVHFLICFGGRLKAACVLKIVKQDFLWQV
jgi:hypothetical protein